MLLTLGARIRFLTNRNIAEISTKEISEMATWNTYQRNPYVNSKEVVGETLEYLNHSIKKSAFHPQMNPNNDKEYAVIECVKHDENGMTPLTITNNSGLIIAWLKNIKSILEPGKLTFFRLIYNEKAKAGTQRWGIEYMNVDKSGDYVPGNDVVNEYEPQENNTDIPF